MRRLEEVVRLRGGRGIRFGREEDVDRRSLLDRDVPDPDNALNLRSDAELEVDDDEHDLSIPSVDRSRDDDVVENSSDKFDDNVEEED